MVLEQEFWTVIVLERVFGSEARRRANKMMGWNIFLICEVPSLFDDTDTRG
jgi:hypothetical protein